MDANQSQMRRFGLALSLTVACGGAFGAFGCSSKSSPALCEGAPDARACFTNHYLRNYRSSGRANCDGTSKLAIEGEKRLALHFSNSVGDIAVQFEGRALQRYFERYDLTFVTDSPALGVGFEYALDGDSTEVMRRAQQEGIDANDDAAMKKLTGRVLGANLRNFVLSKPPNEDLVHVIVIPHVLSPALADELDMKGGTIVGLGISPKLIRDIAETDANKNLFELFDLPEEFTPTLFLGHDDIARLDTGEVGETVAAHELGHSLGLQHTDDPLNLMYPRMDPTRDCRLGLSDVQIGELGEVTLSTLPKATSVPIVDGTDIMVRTLSAMVERVKRARTR